MRDGVPNRYALSTILRTRDIIKLSAINKLSHRLWTRQQPMNYDIETGATIFACTCNISCHVAGCWRVQERCDSLIYADITIT
jgi:hypothetical protein